jgi:A/G-specific adenine glycosylase
MELGAVVCAPRAPQCLLCPVAKSCRARQLGLTDVIPAKRKKRATVEIILAAAVFVDPHGRTLLLPPPHGAGEHATQSEIVPLISRMWHFPAVSVKKDPTTELYAFLSGLGALPPRNSKARLEPLSRARHAVTYRAIKLVPYRVLVAGLPRIVGTKCVLLSELVSRSTLAVSNLTRKIAQSALKEPAKGKQ